MEQDEYRNEFRCYQRFSASVHTVSPIIECEYCLPLAQGYLTRGNLDRASANADEALQIALAQGYPLHEAQAHRILREILAPADFPVAGGHFSHSLEIMQRIEARNEEGGDRVELGTRLRGARGGHHFRRRVRVVLTFDEGGKS